MSYHHQINPELDQDPDNSSIDTALTPPKTIPDLTDDDDHGGPSSRGAPYPKIYWVPEPSSILMIRAVLSRQFLTLFGGQVVSVPAGSLGKFGSPYWLCDKSDGWLGFFNVASGAYLGRNNQWLLRCSALQLQEYEKFHIEGRPEGGYILLMKHWTKLRPVGLTQEKGEMRLAMVEDDENTHGIVWEVEKVQ